MPTTRTDKTALRRSRAVRLIVLLVILGTSTTLGLLHQLLSARPPVSVDALCPFGGIESLWTLIATGTMIRRIAWSSFVLLGAVILSSVLFRRSFCGYVCPLGTLQELFGRLRRPLFGRKNPRAGMIGPRPADRAARVLKYLVLALFTVWAFATATLAIRPYDPWVAYHHLFSSDLFAEFPVGFAVLIAALGGSLILDRACPVNIRVSTRDTVHDRECINCNECVNVFPVHDTLEVGTRQGRTLKPRAVLWGTVGIFSAVVAVATLTGGFQWTLKHITVEAEASGSIDPHLITGRNTLREIAGAVGLPLRTLREALPVADEDLDRPVKEIKDSYGFDTETVRQFVVERLAEQR